MIVVKGYASTERIDRDGDVIRSTAFANSLKDYLQAGGVVLYNHDRDKVIGKCTTAGVDEKGLFVEAEIFTKDKEILTAIRNGALKSFSVGFIAKDAQATDAGLEYKEGDLLEISVVSVPANPEATFEIVQDDNEDKQEDTQLDANKTADEGEVISTRPPAFVVKEAGGGVDEIKNKNKNEEKEMEVEKKSVAEVLGELGVVEEKHIEDAEIEKSVNLSLEKEAREIEKAVNTLTSSPQFATQTTGGIFDGLSDGKLLTMPRWQIEMAATTVKIPILGEASVAEGETGVTTDSSLGTQTITMQAKQYTARYPISYLLEQATQGLVNVVQENLGKSITRAYDNAFFAELATGTAQSMPTTGKAFYQAIITALGEHAGNPADLAIVANTAGYSVLAGFDEFYTVDKFGVNAIVNTGVIGKIFGMDVYMIPKSGNATIIVVNKNYAASGKMGEVKYVSIVDATGTTYVIGKALLGYGVNGVGKVVFAA